MSVAILGAGISGLSLAFFLKKKGVLFEIFEGSERAGGWIQSQQKEGFLFEKGPRSFRRAGTGAVTWDLALSLGLKEELVYEDQAAKIRYIYSSGALKKIGLNFSLIKALFKDLIAPISWKEDESIGNFSRRRFGKEITETLIEPMTLGIYAGDIETLSMKSCFPQLFEWEKREGSCVLGALKNKVRTMCQIGACQKTLFSFRLGSEVLVKALVREVQDHLFFNKRIVSMAPKINGEIELVFADGTVSLKKRVASAIPAFALAKMVEKADAYLASQLREIAFQDIAVVNIGYRKPLVLPKGFGYLVPSKEKEEILGCVFDSSVFPAQNKEEGEVRLTVMLKGQELAEERALLALNKHLNLSQKPSEIESVFIKNAIAQYTVGHFEKIKQIEAHLKEKWSGLHLLGSSFYGVSVNDCIAFAKNKAVEMSTGFVI